MRDPKRIHEFCAKLEELWMKAPDLRLGQIICNACRLEGIYDSFYVEDHKMIKMIDHFIHEFTR